MAADTSSMEVNGNYATTNGQSYDNYDAHAANQSMSAQNDYAGTNASSTSGNANDISKEEVGWYFVEQYYTTLSKSPEKLYLFYTKSSQFVSGIEAEKVSVCVGQKAISDRIKELDIQDCKVRVTNVDSQGSRGNIVIQVIGEISNKSQPQRKFTQTFVLAEQTNGYFVLNDIFRYIADEDEYEPEAEEAPKPVHAEEAAGGYQEPTTTTDTAPEGLTSSQDSAAQEQSAAIVDRSLEQAANEEPAAAAEPVPTTNGDVAGETNDTPAEDDSSAPVTSPQEPVSTAEATETLAPVASLQEEKPQDPVPTPAAASPAKQAPAQPAAPAKPAKPAAPKTWANLVAGNRVAPAIPTAPAPVAPKPAPANTAHPTVVPTGPAAYTAAPDSEAATPTSSGSEWQTAGHEHKRQQSRAQGQQSQEVIRGYIKNVGDNIEEEALKEALNKAGKCTGVDFNRQKKSAFLDFASNNDYYAVVNANPFEVNGQRLFVEERRMGPRPGGFPPRGRGGSGFPRGDRGGRGGFGGRGAAFRGGHGGPQAG